MSNILIDELAEKGWCVTNALFDASVIEDLAEEASQLWKSGEFRTAGIGIGNLKLVQTEIRGDRIFWLDNEALTDVQAKYIAIIESVRAELNYSLFLGLQSFEAHFALYPPGAGYKKHIDRFLTADERSISCVLYLNRNWQVSDGGQLRIYIEDNYVEISPAAGTMVIFRSDSLWHEVMPATRPRWSLTGWFRRRSLRTIVA